MTMFENILRKLSIKTSLRNITISDVPKNTKFIGVTYEKSIFWLAKESSLDNVQSDNYFPSIDNKYVKFSGFVNSTSEPGVFSVEEYFKLNK